MFLRCHWSGRSPGKAGSDVTDKQGMETGAKSRHVAPESAGSGHDGEHDPSERLFVAAWIARRRRTSLRFLAVLASLVHVSSLGFIPLVAHESIRVALTACHLLAAVAMIVAFAMRRREALMQRVSTGLIFVFLPLYVILVGYAARVLESQLDVLIASAGAMAYAVFGILLYPASRRTLVLLVSGLVALGVGATSPIAGGIVWGLIFGAVCLLLLATRLTMDASVEREAAVEYRFRRLVAPAHIVRRSLDNTETLLEAFRTELKFCVCIATDWRDYQAFSTQLSPSQLTMTLDEYYTLCVRILNRCLPEGNYYADWIADELFVVLYAHGDMTDAKLIDAALRFSSELIQQKDSFARVHQLPKAIDIGVSAGAALLGLMGPEGHKKATALGSVPGRARRFQGAGKLLRHRRGDRDRIVFGRECLLRIKSGFKVEEMALAANESVRDVSDRELFYIEPTVGDDQPKRGVA